MALGGIIGTILSGASNTLAANPLGVALGAGQMIAGALQRKKAQAMAPSPVDVGRQRLLNELMRQQKRVLTGTQAAGKDAQQLAKTMQRSAFAAGGAVPNYSGKIISDIMNNIREGEANQVLNLNTQIAQSTGEMEKRKFDLQSLAQSKMEADAALNKKSGFQNLAASMMPADQNYKNEAIPKDESDAYDFTKSLYSENEMLKKKMKELEEQNKKNAEATGANQ